MAEYAELIVEGKTYKFPINIGSEGEKAIDISKLRQLTGLITLDPGFANTGCCTSTITFMDGEKGILRYRGIPIEELGEHSTFLSADFSRLGEEVVAAIAAGADVFVAGSAVFFYAQLW